MAGGDEIAVLAHEGVAITVATRDADLRPELTRAWAPEISPDGDRLTLCVEGGTDSVTAANLAAGSPVAAILARIASREAVQLKGTAVSVAAPTPERLLAVAEHLDRFVAETAAVGVPEQTARALLGPELLDVTIDVGEAPA